MDKEVIRQDTISNFPTGYRIAVTNPPWLAKNSAKARGLPFPDTEYSDLYLYCLSLCLDNCEYVAALVPATFLQSGLFHDRLEAFVLLHDPGMFGDTDNPVGLALFSVKSRDTEIFYDDQYIGSLSELKQHLPCTRGRVVSMEFNCSDGVLGFVSFDGTDSPSIRFMPGEDLADYDMKHSSRMITRINGSFDDVILFDLIDWLNDRISAFREETSDVFLTPFKGLRADSMYRRRMNYSLARRFIVQGIDELSPLPRLF